MKSVEEMGQTSMVVLSAASGSRWIRRGPKLVLVLKQKAAALPSWVCGSVPVEV